MPVLPIRCAVAARRAHNARRSAPRRAAGSAMQGQQLGELAQALRLLLQPAWRRKRAMAVEQAKREARDEEGAEW